MSKHMAKLQADKLDLMGDHAMENGQLATAEHWYDKADAIREEYGIEEDIGPGMKKMRDFFRNLRSITHHLAASPLEVGACESPE